MEKWAAIDWSGGNLEISSLGRVRSNMRDGRILKQQADKKGYLRVRVTINGERRTVKTHREVARAFIPNPFSLEQVNHKDGNKGNNRVENLEWVSCLENARHAIRQGLWDNVFAASKRANDAKAAPIVSVDVVTGQKRRFKSVSDAERFFGTRHISAVLNGERRKAKGQYFFREGGGACAEP